MLISEEFVRHARCLTSPQLWATRLQLASIERGIIADAGHARAYIFVRSSYSHRSC
jgi:hypothetical protein